MASTPRAIALASRLAGCGVTIADGPPGSGGDGKGDGDPGGGGGGTPQMTATAYLIELAKIECAQLFTCRSSFPGTPEELDAGFGATVAECTALALTSFEPGELETAIAKHRVSYDAGAAASCIASFSAVVCTTLWQSGFQFDDACYQVVAGSIPDGDSFESSYEFESYGSVCSEPDRRCAPTSPAWLSSIESPTRRSRVDRQGSHRDARRGRSDGRRRGEDQPAAAGRRGDRPSLPVDELRSDLALQTGHRPRSSDAHANRGT
jgi:hypothetical protein